MPLTQTHPPKIKIVSATPIELNPPFRALNGIPFKKEAHDLQPYRRTITLLPICSEYWSRSAAFSGRIRRGLCFGLFSGLLKNQELATDCCHRIGCFPQLTADLQTAGCTLLQEHLGMKPTLIFPRTRDTLTAIHHLPDTTAAVLQCCNSAVH
jgi:hypothetical protein